MSLNTELNSQRSTDQRQISLQIRDSNIKFKIPALFELVGSICFIDTYPRVTSNSESQKEFRFITLSTREFQESLIISEAMYQAEVACIYIGARVKIKAERHIEGVTGYIDNKGMYLHHRRSVYSVLSIDFQDEYAAYLIEIKKASELRLSEFSRDIDFITECINVASNNDKELISKQIGLAINIKTHLREIAEILKLISASISWYSENENPIH